MTDPTVPVEPDTDPALPDEAEPDDDLDPVETTGPAASSDGDPQDEVPA